MGNPEKLATLGVQDGQSRDTGNIRCTRQRQTKHTQKHTTTQKTKKMSNTDPTKNMG